MSTTQDAVAVPQLFTGTQQVQTGTFYYGYAQNPGEWFLSQGSGPRKFDAEIKFPQPFATTPTVMIAMTGVDADHNFNTRITVVSSDVTAADFEVIASAWADSIIYSVWGSWIAIG